VATKDEIVVAILLSRGGKGDAIVRAGIPEKGIPRLKGQAVHQGFLVYPNPRYVRAKARNKKARAAVPWA
jgi:hypothetical protein